MIPPYVPPSVAVIGLSGSGKTTLAVTLANRLVSPDKNGVYMVPLNHATMVTVQRHWLELQSQKFPDTTLDDSFIELRWRLNVGGQRSCEFRIVDVSGQDLYMIFTDDNCHVPEKLGESRARVFDYCRNANIALLLLNLGDFLGEGDRELALRNEAALKSAMDFLRLSEIPKRICLVVTQAELFEHDASSAGGWKQLLAECVPFLFNAHLRSGDIPFICVSAVSDTVPSGRQRIPAMNFRSRGLDQLITWLARQVLSFPCPNHPFPRVVESKLSWGGVASTYLIVDATIRNEGGTGSIRALAKSVCDGEIIETVSSVASLAQYQESGITFKLKSTKYASGKEFSVIFDFELA